MSSLTLMQVLEKQLANTQELYRAKSKECRVLEALNEDLKEDLSNATISLSKLREENELLRANRSPDLSDPFVALEAKWSAHGYFRRDVFERNADYRKLFNVIPGVPSDLEQYRIPPLASQNMNRMQQSAESRNGEEHEQLEKGKKVAKSTSDNWKSYRTTYRWLSRFKYTIFEHSANEEDRVLQDSDFLCRPFILAFVDCRRQVSMPYLAQANVGHIRYTINYIMQQDAKSYATRAGKSAASGLYEELGHLSSELGKQAKMLSLKARGQPKSAVLGAWLTVGELKFLFVSIKEALSSFEKQIREGNIETRKDAVMRYQLLFLTLLSIGNGGQRSEFLGQLTVDNLHDMIVLREEDGARLKVYAYTPIREKTASRETALYIFPQQFTRYFTFWKEYGRPHTEFAEGVRAYWIGRKLGRPLEKSTISAEIVPRTIAYFLPGTWITASVLRHLLGSLGVQQWKAISPDSPATIEEIVDINSRVAEHANAINTSPSMWNRIYDRHIGSEMRAYNAIEELNIVLGLHPNSDNENAGVDTGEKGPDTSGDLTTTIDGIHHIVGHTEDPRTGKSTLFCILEDGNEVEFDTSYFACQFQLVRYRSKLRLYTCRLHERYREGYFDPSFKKCGWVESGTISAADIDIYRQALLDEVARLSEGNEAEDMDEAEAEGKEEGVPSSTFSSTKKMKPDAETLTSKEEMGKSISYGLPSMEVDKSRVHLIHVKAKRDREGKLEELKCDLCERSYKLQTSFNKHLREKHPEYQRSDKRGRPFNKSVQEVDDDEEEVESAEKKMKV